MLNAYKHDKLSECCQIDSFQWLNAIRYVPLMISLQHRLRFAFGFPQPRQKRAFNERPLRCQLRFLERRRAQESDRSTERTDAERIAGRSSYQPESFEVIVQDATASMLSAMEDGEKRIEVEFPPLPPSVSGEVNFKPNAFHIKTLS